MAKQVIWSSQAKKDLKAILYYWEKRNKSKVYPKKLNRLIRAAIKILAQYEIPRRQTDFHKVFVKIVREYKIYFSENEGNIYIITIWDTRQNPDSLGKRIKDKS